MASGVRLHWYRFSYRGDGLMNLRLVRRTVLAAAPLLVALALATGCSKLPGNADAAQNDTTTVADGSQRESLPFSKRGPEGRDQKSLVPDQVTIPAGTSVAVRLQSSVSSASAQPGEHFDAVLDEPLVVNGHTVAQ